MDKYIGKFKTNVTLYFDYNDGYWSDDKPDGECNEDYDLLRKGSVMDAYELKEPFCDIDGNEHTILLQGCKGIYFPNIESVRECGWFDEVKSKKEAMKEE